MCKKHDKKRNHKTVEFKLGDKVSVKIPKVDVGGTDLPRLPFVIVAVIRDKFKLTSEYGIIDVRAND